MRAIVLEPEPLTHDAFDAFGWIPVDDTDSRDAAHQYEFTWGDTHVNLISHARGEVEQTARGQVCAGMYRHDSHTQTLMPLNVSSVVAVAPAGIDFSQAEHLDTVRAFRLEPLECFALARGTWHWGPFPVGDEPVRMFNVQGKRYAEDNTFVDLAARAGAVFEVLT